MTITTNKTVQGEREMKKNIKKAIVAVTVTMCLLGALGVAESAKGRSTSLNEAYDVLGATYQMAGPRYTGQFCYN